MKLVNFIEYILPCQTLLASVHMFLLQLTQCHYLLITQFFVYSSLHVASQYLQEAEQQCVVWRQPGRQERKEGQLAGVWLLDYGLLLSHISKTAEMILLSELDSALVDALHVCLVYVMCTASASSNLYYAGFIMWRTVFI